MSEQDDKPEDLSWLDAPELPAVLVPPGYEKSQGKYRPKSPRILGHGSAKVQPIPAPPNVEGERDGAGRFVKGNAAGKLRAAKAMARTRGVMTLNPTKCAAWLAPHVRDGQGYGVDLIKRVPDPVLARLAGDVADARAVYRALLGVAASEDTDASERIEALREARAWLREHRASLATLSALAGVKPAGGDADPFYVADEDAKR